MGGLLVAGTTSDAGKSLVAAGLCRALARRGVRVAPFKAQNMSNNSMVVPGGEIGRAQWLQARAAGVTPSVDMNPVLLKPATDRRSHIVLRGRPAGTLEAGQYATGRRELAEAAWQAYADLSADHEVVVCEGAGSPAEINLRTGDYTNMGLARRFDLPVALVADIDRGGMLAAAYGTWALLPYGDRTLLRGYVVNKFRGDVEVLRPGLETLTARTGMAELGVLPWLEGVDLDSEDTLHVTPPRALVTASGPMADAASEEVAARRRLRIAVVRLPRVSNATDIDALACEPNVDIVVTTRPEVCASADLVVLPGSRSTVADLEWVRTSGLAATLLYRAAAGLPVLGICGGFQMLGRTIHDPRAVELAAGPPSTSPASVQGLGLLPVETAFHPEKTLDLVRGSWQDSGAAAPFGGSAPDVEGPPEDGGSVHVVEGYAIHHGVVTRDPSTTPFLDGAQQGAVYGTLWHGTMESDDFRRAFLGMVARRSGSQWRPDPDAPGFDARRESMLDRLADAIEEHAPGLVDLAMGQRGA